MAGAFDELPGKGVRLGRLPPAEGSGARLTVAPPTCTGFTMVTALLPVSAGRGAVATAVVGLDVGRLLRKSTLNICPGVIVYGSLRLLARASAAKSRSYIQAIT